MDFQYCFLFEMDPWNQVQFIKQIKGVATQVGRETQTPLFGLSLKLHNSRGRYSHGRLGGDLPGPTLTVDGGTHNLKTLA